MAWVYALAKGRSKPKPHLSHYQNYEGIFLMRTKSEVNKGVYIAIDSGAGFNMGVSKDFKKTEKQIRETNPSFTMVFGILPPDEYSPEDFVEYYKNKYEDKKITKEWLDLSIRDISEILKENPVTIEIAIKKAREMVNNEQR